MDARTIPKFSRRWHCFAIGLAALLLLTVFVAACGEDPTPTPPAAVVLSVPQQQEVADAPTLDASPPQSVPSSSAGAFGFSHYVFEDVGGEVITTLVEGPVDEQVRAPVSYQQLKAKYENGETLDGLAISRQELGELVGQLDTVRDATAKYRDIRVALAEGYLQTTEDVPNMGAHFIHPIRALDGLFDPAKPEILMYSGDDELGWRLVGTSFVLPREQVGDQHPQAFVGPLDNWHVHYSLCTGPNSISRSTTPEQCAEEQRRVAPILRMDDSRLGVERKPHGRVQHVEPQRTALGVHRRGAPIAGHLCAGRRGHSRHHRELQLRAYGNSHRRDPHLDQRRRCATHGDRGH